MTYEWSPEKEKVFRFDSNICVSAGAGSGKTTALAELVIRVLSGETLGEPVEIEKILAITFTDKAATEMKDKIRSQIELKRQSETDPDRLRIWLKARKDLLSAGISTIHSFCGRILKDNPLESGVDPNFEMLDEDSSSEMLEEICRNLILKEIEGNNAIAGLVTNGKISTTIENIVSALERIRSTGESPGNLNKILSKQYSKANRLFQQGKADLADILEELFHADTEERIRKKAFHSKWKIFNENGRDIISRIRKMSLPPDEEDRKLLKELEQLLKGNVPGEIKPFKEETDRLISTANNGILPHIISFIESYPTQKAISDLIQKLYRLYAEEKENRSSLDFEDVLFMARNILRDNLNVRRKYKKKYRLIMVDEFQDVNRLQMEIVYLLAEKEGEEQILQPDNLMDNIEHQPRKLFVVGDMKQSIYFFRGADVGVFNQVMADFRKRGGQMIPFQENFRTLDRIINTINPLFANLMRGGEDAHEIEFTDEHYLTPIRKDELNSARVEIIYPPALPKNEETSCRETEAEILARRILSLTDKDSHVRIAGRKGMEPPGFRDICMLFSTLNDSGAYEEALKKRNIPYYIVKGRNYFTCQEVLDILNVLRYLAGSRMDESIAGILRSPMGACRDETLAELALLPGEGKGLSERFILGDFSHIPEEERNRLLHCREILQGLECLKDRLPLGELINLILERFDYPAILLSTFQGEQKISNLRKLVSMARDYDDRAIYGLNGFIKNIEKKFREKTKEEEAQLTDESLDAVKMMTIHQAKGLEFPVVIVPDMGRKNNFRSQPIEFLPDVGFACQEHSPETDKPQKNYYFELIRNKRASRENAEYLRKLYVALTRAKDYLILSNANFNSKTWVTMLRDFIGKEEIEQFLSSDETEALLSFTPLEDSALAQFRLLKSSGIKSISQESIGRLIDELPELSPLNEKKLADLIVKEQKNIAGIKDRNRIKTLKSALEFRKPPGNTLSLTPTELLKYQFCPRFYFYDSLISSPFRGAEENAGDLSNPAGRGTILHKILESIDFKKGKDKILEQVERRITDLLWENDSPTAERELELIRQAIIRFINSEELEKLEVFNEKSRILKELNFSIRIGNEKNKTALYLRGAIDNMIFTEKGEGIILDYKYTTPPNHDDVSKIHYQRQLKCYALTMKKSIPILSIQAHLIYIQPENTTFISVPTYDEELQVFESELMDIAEEICHRKNQRNEKAWPVRTVPLQCLNSNCRFYSRCFEEQSAV